MSTLTVVEEILREARQPLSVREIVERAGEALPTRSKTPDTVVARDLSMDLKRRPLESLFTRTSPGRYTLKALVAEQAPVTAPIAAPQAAPPSILSQALGTDRAGTRPAPAPAQSRNGTSSFSV
jgi:hypothetical protein